MFKYAFNELDFVADFESQQTEFKRRIAKQTITELDGSVKSLFKAAELLESAGLNDSAERIFNVLERLAESSPSPQQMVSNLLDHGTVLPVPKNDMVPAEALSKAEPIVGGMESKMVGDSNKAMDYKQHMKHELSPEHTDWEKGEEEEMEKNEEMESDKTEPLEVKEEE